MSRTTLGIDPALRDYLLEVSVREPQVLARLREHTGSMRNSNMQISPEQGQFLHFLIRLIGASMAIEVGTFTGYSALWTALALPPEGRLIACDVSEEWTAVARRYWNEAGVSDRIVLRLAPAVETLSGLLDEGMAGNFDFAFIDADKESYGSYYELCLELVRPGGLIALDNVLRGGRVLHPEPGDAGTEAIVAMNSKLSGDDRVDVSMIPIGDGLTLLRKRPVGHFDES